MKRPSFILANVLFVALITIILIPGRMDTPTNVPFIVATVIIEALFLWHYLPKSKRKPSSCYIVIIVWVLLIVWELVSTDLGLTHPVLIPLPENVFAVFSNKTPELMRNIKSSLTLFAEGFLTAIVVGNLLGLIVGWLPRVRETVYPIARVLAPVPAIVFTPYLIFLLPSFRMAAAMVIFLGIFWSTMLNTILRIEAMDKRIVDTAKMLGVGTGTMIFKVLLPYLYPSIAKGLKLQLPSAMLIMVMSEMYGATSGLGYFIINYTNYANYTNVVAGIILVGIVVTVLDWLVTLFVKKTVRWSE
ncbi:MAG: ABC transporter permease subunit [Coriobacteriales bacterium]|nr:ABC transporter permease subunit [Coriobacteriales bacterium]MBQ6586140.1 ABC transporter permease subunit [Coriobacteriales bacterium]